MMGASKERREAMRKERMVSELTQYEGTSCYKIELIVTTRSKRW